MGNAVGGLRLRGDCGVLRQACEDGLIDARTAKPGLCRNRIRAMPVTAHRHHRGGRRSRITHCLTVHHAMVLAVSAAARRNRQIGGSGECGQSHQPAKYHHQNDRNAAPHRNLECNAARLAPKRFLRAAQNWHRVFSDSYRAATAKERFARCFFSGIPWPVSYFLAGLAFAVLTISVGALAAMVIGGSRKLSPARLAMACISIPSASLVKIRDF